MSPRGYHQRESISPYFSTNAYKQSEQGQHEAAMEKAIEDKVKGLISVPRKLIKMVWHYVLVKAGYVQDLTK